MPCDALTYSFAAAELNSALKGGRIDKVTMPEKDEVLLFVRASGKNHTLCISCGRYGRLHLSQRVKPSPMAAFSFCMNLRKNIGGGIIESVQCPADERIIIINILFKNELGIREDKRLICEIMGKYSNIILTGSDEKIYECVRHIGLDTPAKRPILPGLKYSVPTQDRLSPADAAGISALSFASDPAGVLHKNIKGLSPLSISEAVYNSGIENGGDVSALCASLKKLYTEPLNPCVQIKDGEPADYFIRPYNCLGGGDGEYVFFDTVNAAMDYYYSKKSDEAGLQTQVKSLLAPLKNALKRAQKRLGEFCLKRESCEGLEDEKVKGELITGNIYRLKQGMASFTATDYYSEEPAEITVQLDPLLTPAQNAQQYFKRYRKKKRTIESVSEQITKTEHELAVLNALNEDLENCTEPNELIDIKEEMERLGLIKASKRDKNQKRSQPHRFDVDGFGIIAGKNNVQNDRITKNAQGRDVWLHVKGYGGSHVIIETGGRSVPDSVLFEAAKIAVRFSKAQDAGKAEVDYTLVKHVSKEVGAPAGKVVFTNQKTIVVTSV